ncbi:phage tail protein [Pilimelia anulata]|uniref:Phage tail protein n=1 Tax=Pilimelia anulata TaxID=53371 RepID=A0A8J3BCN7_9ACTN|nr:phage tail protein [Pilimelia anulata]GGK10082.1 phage tail protein [Pilimelia anulata]
MAETGDTFATHRFQVELGKARVESVQEVSGLTVELDAIEVNQVTPTGEYLIRKIPGARKGGEVTITRGLDQSSAFTDWIKDTFEKGAIDTARQNISIIIVDSKNEAQRRFDLSNAWVSKWEGPNLKAGDASPATEKVTVVFEDITSS